MLQILKEATKNHHSSVEKVLVTQFKNLKSNEEYAALLNKLYGFYRDVEEKVHFYIKESELPDIKKRIHVLNIALDLKKLGKEPLVISNPFALSINSISYAFGVMYVIEGSTLGGQVISTLLKKQLDTIKDDSLNYFTSYGKETYEMWSVFKSNFDINSVYINEQEVISGAKETFEHLRLWLLKN